MMGSQTFALCTLIVSYPSSFSEVQSEPVFVCLGLRTKLSVSKLIKNSKA